MIELYKIRMVKILEKTLGKEKKGLSSVLFIIGFLVNLIWEISQISYFEDKSGSEVWGWILYCSLASIIDGIIVVVIYLIANIFFKNPTWKFYMSTIILGALFAVIFEKIAFYFELWSYGENMLIIPFIEVGILPLTQLMVLVPFCVFLTNKIFRKE